VDAVGATACFLPCPSDGGLGRRALACALPALRSGRSVGVWRWKAAEIRGFDLLS
jgi:hypothetical protein